MLIIPEYTADGEAQMVDIHIRKRIFIIGIILILLTLVLAVKLFCKQANFQGYNNKILHQSVRKIRIPARRGRIYSADYKVIADNRMIFDLLLYIHEIRRPGKEKTIEAVINEIIYMALLLGRENKFTRADIERHLNWYPGLPLKVFSDLNEKERAIINDHLADHRGWALEIDSVRVYPQKDWAAHLVGYTRKGDPADAADRKEFSYYISDYEGKAGLEKVFDRINSKEYPALRGLRGKPGYSLVQVDNLGYVHHSLVQEISPLHGNHVVLNLEYNAQKKAQELLKYETGALVLVDADNGDVLAMASSPGYDLSRFSPRVEQDYYNKLVKDKTAPLLAKAFAGTYTPGSIIKVLIGLAILENGTAPESTVFCDGSTHIGDAKINCASYRFGGHRDMDIYGALEKSCNDYFIEEGLKIGREKICDFMKAAGFGTAPALELPCASGLLPTVQNKYRIQKTSRWTDFDTALISIGQGLITISPLQAALYTAAIANNGKVFRPHLVNSILDHQGNILYQRKSSVASVIPASEAGFKAVREGMFRVVNSPTGSGRNGKLENYTIYGKTGTAEIGSKNNRRQNTWFIAFVKHNNRTYAAALVIQDGQSGGMTCAPVMAEFLEYYLDSKTDAQ